MRELSVTEQRYQAILAVIRDGRTATEVASEWRVSRQTVHTWLSRYEAGGLEELGDRSHRPASCPQQISGELEAMVLELRRWKPYWGPHSLVLELARRKVAPLEDSVLAHVCSRLGRTLRFILVAGGARRELLYSVQHLLPPSREADRPWADEGRWRRAWREYAKASESHSRSRAKVE
jgi:transposase